MTTFADLGIQEALCPVLEQQGIKEPTGIQREMIGRVLSGRNLIAQAPTGTGKTLAYLLPALQRIDAAKRQTQVLILAPTYELAMQIAGVARTLSREAGLGVGVLGLIGGASLARQADKLKEKPQLVTGSAGRILELARQGKLKLRDTALLVLDEFDRMLDDQNLQDTAAVVRLLPKDRQVVMVSATVSKKALERADFLGSPERITVGEDEAAQKKREIFLVAGACQLLLNVRQRHNVDIYVTCPVCDQTGKLQHLLPCPLACIRERLEMHRLKPYAALGHHPAGNRRINSAGQQQ